MNWTWTPPVFGIGWLVAAVVLIAACLLAFMGELSREALLVTAAICAYRL